MPAEDTSDQRVSAFLKGPEPAPGPVDNLPVGHPALETLKKVAGVLMYAIPHYGQYKVRQDAATAAMQVRQQAAMQHAVLSDAMKHPEAFDSPEAKKAAVGLFGPQMGQNFIQVIGALAKRDYAQKTGFAKRFTEYQQQHPDDLDALAHVIHDSLAQGQEVPKEAVTALIQGHERVSTAAKMTPELIRRHAGETQANIDVQTDPSNVEATAAAGGVKAGATETARQTAREPYAKRAEERRNTAANARADATAARQNARADATAARQEATRRARLEEVLDKPLGTSASKWHNQQGEQAPAELTPREASKAGYAPTDPKDRSLFGFGPQKPPKVGSEEHTPLSTVDPKRVDAVLESFHPTPSTAPAGGAATAPAAPAGGEQPTAPASKPSMAAQRAEQLMHEVNAGRMSQDEAADILRHEYPQGEK